MTDTSTRGEDVAKKKADQKPKRYGTLIRVSDKAADVFRAASSFEQKSIADYVDEHLVPVAAKKHRDAVIKEAKRMEGKG